MSRTDVENMRLKDLLVLDAKIKAAIADAREKGKAELKIKVANLAQQHGFSVDELFGGVRNKSGKVNPPKYANPNDPTQTWTGRGRKPNWVIANMKKGRRLEDFAI